MPEVQTLFAAIEQETRNSLIEHLERRATPTSALFTGGDSVELQVLEKIHDGAANDAGPLSHSDQAFNVSESSYLIDRQDHDYEDSEYTTSDHSTIEPSSAGNLRHLLKPTIPASMWKEKELQARRTARQDQTRSQLATSDTSDCEIVPLECGSPSNDKAGRKRKRPSPRIEQEDESRRRIAETFGNDRDLEYFEQIVDNAKANAHWISGAWTPRNLLSMPDVDPLQFVQALPNLVEELEHNDFAERLLQVKQRIALAHFYSAYRSAHANHEMFLRWTEGIGNSGVSLTPRDGRRTESVVKQRFIGISVWQSQRDRKHAAVRINNWQRCGKPWAELIVRLGYSSLLLVPPSMTNKR